EPHRHSVLERHGKRSFSPAFCHHHLSCALRFRDGSALVLRRWRRNWVVWSSCWLRRRLRANGSDVEKYGASDAALARPAAHTRGCHDGRGGDGGRLAFRVGAACSCEPNEAANARWRNARLAQRPQACVAGALGELAARLVRDQAMVLVDGCRKVEQDLQEAGQIGGGGEIAPARERGT